MLKDFSDIHYVSKEATTLGVSPGGSYNGSFSAREPLPGIGSARGSAAITNIFRKVFKVDVYLALWTVFKHMCVINWKTEVSSMQTNIYKYFYVDAGLYPEQ